MIRLRLTDVAAGRSPGPTASPTGPFGSRFDEIVQARRDGGRRVLRRRHPRRRSDADAANVMRQALAGMLWSKQFYHYDVDKWLEERGSDPFKATRKAVAAQRPLAPHVQRRRHLDAGQVGVPLVRGLGPRLPRPRPDARRPGLRQAATQADAARALHAPQRPDPGLRVELRRRQPAGPRLVHHLHLPPGEGADGRGRQGLAQEQLPEAAAELHLVGQPQGPHRAGTSSRAASWAWTTSASSTAARRCRPAATWSRPTAPPGWPCSARTCWRSPSSWR